MKSQFYQILFKIIKKGEFLGSIGSYLDVESSELYFNGCDSCNGECCNGSEGYALTPLILEDIESVYKNFEILFGFLNDELRLFMVLNDGNGHCRHYIEGKCSIYSERPPACRLYPVTPYFDRVLVDTSCPSVNSLKIGEKVFSDNELHPMFQNSRLNNFNEKLSKTTNFLKDIDTEKLSFRKSVLGVDLLYFNGNSNSHYIKRHLESINF